MKDLSDIERELRSGPKGRRIMEAANSEEAQRLAKSLDKGAVEAALRSGDGEKLKAILDRLLSTPEGQSLAGRLSKTMREK